MVKKSINYKYFLMKYKMHIVLLISMYVITIITSVLIPLLLGNMITMLETDKATFKNLLCNFIAVIVTFGIWDFMEVLIDTKFAFVNKSIENSMREYFIDKLLNADYETISNKSEGELLNKIIKDTQVIEKSFSNLFSYIVTIINAIFLAVAMIMLNKNLTVILMVLYCGVMVVQKLSGKKLELLYLDLKKLDDSLLERFNTQLKGIFTTKALSIEGNRLEELREKNNENLGKYRRVAMYKSTIKNANFFVLSTCRPIAVFAGGLLYLQNMITIGAIFTMDSYVIQLSNRLRTIVELDIIMKDVKTSMARLKDLVKEFEGTTDTEKIHLDSINKIDFKNVSYSYEDKLVLNDITFTAKKGDIIGIRGENGTGKSTLSKLISGFLRSGGIYYNEIDASNIRKSSIIKNSTLVLQSVFLYPSTVKENLTSFSSYRIEKANEIISILKLEAFFSRFGNNFEKEVNDKNINISGGEKQLISLVRALSKPHDVLILDEFNSALDTSVKKLIHR